MPLSNSVIRRYTPPTCTLEVLAQSSPLSRWMGKSVLKQVRFNLLFDDPRQPEDEKVVVQGNQDQLEALYTSVSSYVQKILEQSPENFWASRVEAHYTSKISEPTALKDVPNSEQDLSNSKNEFAKRRDIYLQPSSNLTHQLFLGSLASHVSGSSIKLGLLQLFDLATALDEYMADVVALPTQTQQPRRSSFAIPAWAPVAAVLVLGLGLMPLTYQYANRLREENKTGETLETANKEIGNNAASTPLLTPLPTPTSLLTPSPNVSPLPTLGTGLYVPNASLPTPGASPDPTLSTPKKPGSTFPSASNPNSSLSSVPLAPLGSSNPSDTAKKTQIGEQAAIKPNFGGNSSTSTPKSSTSLPSTTSLPTLKNPSISKTPETSLKQTAPSPQSQNSSQGNLLTNSSKTRSNVAAKLRESPQATPANNGDKSTATAAANSETLFDTNQVSEVRDYLTKRWQPPGALKQPLEYSLTVGVDGALEQILPLGKTARDNVDKAGIPQIGQPFVSPSRSGQNVKVRAVLRPDGKVQVFPETD